MKDDKYNNYFSDGQIDYFLLNDDYIIGPTTDKKPFKNRLYQYNNKKPMKPRKFWF